MIYSEYIFDGDDQACKIIIKYSQSIMSNAVRAVNVCASSAAQALRVDINTIISKRRALSVSNYQISSSFDVFSKYESFENMLNVTDKTEILTIFERLVSAKNIPRKSSKELCEKYSVAILNNIDSYNAEELSLVINSMNELGRLNQAFFVKVAPRINETIKSVFPLAVANLASSVAKSGCASLSLSASIVERSSALASVLSTPHLALVIESLPILPVIPTSDQSRRIIESLNIGLESRLVASSSVSGHKAVLALSAADVARITKGVLSLNPPTHTIELLNKCIASVVHRAKASDLNIFAEFQMALAPELKCKIVSKLISEQMETRLAQFSRLQLARTIGAIRELGYFTPSMMSQITVSYPRILAHADPTDICALTAAVGFENLQNSKALTANLVRKIGALPRDSHKDNLRILLQDFAELSRQNKLDDRSTLTLKEKVSLWQSENSLTNGLEELERDKVEYDIQQFAI